MTSSCGHDGWAAGCPVCEANQQVALAAMGEPRPVVIRELEALRVGPDEVLVIRIPAEDPEDPYVQASASEITDALERVGLGSRSLVILGDVEFSVAPRDPSTEGDPR